MLFMLFNGFPVWLIQLAGFNVLYASGGVYPNGFGQV
jgi:hypothetical protein